MSGFKPGQVVTVLSLGRNRIIVDVVIDKALCRSFSTGREDWFSLSDLKPADNSPIQPYVK